jgi:hypothetical protein
VFDIKQIDGQYSPTDQLLIALGAHPDQLAAQEQVKSNVGNAPAPASGGAMSPVTPAPSSTGQPNYVMRSAEDAKASAGAAAGSADVPRTNLPRGTNLRLAMDAQTQGTGSQIAPIARAADAKPLNIPSVPSAAAGPLAADQAEVQRLNSTGSGVSQIHNKWLRGIARVGDIAGSALFPTVMQNVPGTELHHRVLLNEAQGKVNQDLEQGAKQATTAHTQAETEGMENKPGAAATPITDAAGEILGWKAGEEILGPNNPKLTQDQRDIMAAAHGKPNKDASPEAQTFLKLITGDPAHGVPPMPHVDALKVINEAKKQTQEKAKDTFQEALQKAIAGAGGKVDSGIYTSLAKAADFIGKSTALTPDEKNAALGYMGANPTPMSTGTTTQIRVEGMQGAREMPVINTQTRQIEYRSAADINAANKVQAGLYVPADQAGKIASRESAFNDFHYTINGARQSIQALDDMDAGTRAKLAYALKSSDPHSAFQSFMQGTDIGSMTPQQQDAVQWLSVLSENAMALRTVQGLGQGSDELRSAVQAILPSGKSPSKDYSLKQLDKFEGIVNRLEQSVPHSGLVKSEGSSAAAPAAAKKDFGAAPAGAQEGHTGTAADGTKVIVKGGRIVEQ